MEWYAFFEESREPALPDTMAVPGSGIPFAGFSEEH
jgi:hypothetical protein